MDQMTSDMSGAAAVVATVIAAAKLELPVAVTAYAALAENMPSGSAYRPGDVLRHYGGVDESGKSTGTGKTVHVLNTDAEGRLVLADAIVRACEDEPDYLLETSTLTGAQVVALGNRTMGVMGTPELRDRVAELARQVGEGGWAMPLPEHLREGLDSPLADLQNIAGDPGGGMLVAGHYLAEFVADGVSWAHLDIAGPSFNDGKPYGYTDIRRHRGAGPDPAGSPRRTSPPAEPAAARWAGRGPVSRRGSPAPSAAGRSSAGGSSRASAAGSRRWSRRRSAASCRARRPCARLRRGDPAAGELAVVRDQHHAGAGDGGLRFDEDLDAAAAGRPLRPARTRPPCGRTGSAARCRSFLDRRNHENIPIVDSLSHRLLVSGPAAGSESAPARHRHAGRIARSGRCAPVVPDRPDRPTGTAHRRRRRGGAHPWGGDSGGMPRWTARAGGPGPSLFNQPRSGNTTPRTAERSMQDGPVRGNSASARSDVSVTQHGCTTKARQTEGVRTDDRYQRRPGGSRRRVRRLRRRPPRRRAGFVGGADREGEGRRHLPALGLRSGQDPAACRRGRRRGQGGPVHRRQDHLRRRRRARPAQVQGRHHQPALQGPDRAGEVPRDHHRRGRGQVRRPEHRGGRRRPLHRQGRHPGHRFLLPDAARPGRSRAGSSPPPRR